MEETHSNIKTMMPKNVLHMFSLLFCWASTGISRERGHQEAKTLQVGIFGKTAVADRKDYHALQVSTKKKQTTEIKS